MRLGPGINLSGRANQIKSKKKKKTLIWSCNMHF